MDSCQRENRVPLWLADDVPLSEPSLSSDVETDVCVIGAGIAGMSVAYELAAAGRQVVVLEDGRIGSGQTSHTTAHLSNAWDDRYYQMDRLLGNEASRVLADSHTAAIDRIEQVAERESIGCDFARLDGFLFLAPGDSIDVLDDELRSCRRAGLEGMELLTDTPFADVRLGPALRFPRQGQFHPLKYLSGLARATTHHGGRIYCHTHARRVEGGELARIETDAGPAVAARHVVVATNTPINDQYVIHTKQAPYMTYAIGIRVVDEGVLPTALFWDTGDPYHYVRLQRVTGGDGQRPHDVLIVGGEDHKTGQADDATQRYLRLEEFAHRHFPSLGAVEFRWSGQVMEPVDGVAFIGRNPGEENVYIVTGDSGMGMTHGAIAGMLIRDLILGRDNPWAELYDPSRKTIRAAAEFVKENLNVALQFSDYLTGSEIGSAEELSPGQAGLIRQGMGKIAVFRDDQGELHEMSAACPHLGCIVHWNSDDRTWDCPCHGSRFTCTGKVISGPANVDLPRVEHAVHGA